MLHLLHAACAGLGLTARAALMPAAPRARGFSRTAVVASGALGKAITSAGPPLPHKPLGAILGTGDPTFEIFLDLSCPFSVKAFNTIFDEVEPAHRGKASFLIHNVVQPWHAQSTVMHEAALAVREVAPELYFKYYRAICAGYETFTNEAVKGETRAHMAERLAMLAESSCEVPFAVISAMLEHSGKGAAGCAVTQDIKWACKHHRARGVHVTPTVFLHGLEASGINSGWTAEQWAALIKEVRDAQ